MEICELAEAVAAEIQTQQRAQMTQAADLGYAITLPDNQQVRHCNKKCLYTCFRVIDIPGVGFEIDCVVKFEISQRSVG